MPKPQHKLPIWLPYTNEIITKKDIFEFHFKGGELKIAHKDILSIMFYGAVCPLEERFLDMCVKKQIPICIYRRNLTKAIWILGNTTNSQDDILTKQILYKNNKIKSKHIAKKLIEAKFKGMLWCVGHKDMYLFRQLKSASSIQDIRTIEAVHAKRYWSRYYSYFGQTKPQRRVNEDEIAAILNAVSKLISGIMLRWIMYHKLSPHHGFLHTPTNYPALAYDLLEPYRGYIEKEVLKHLLEIHFDYEKDEKIVGFIISRVEGLMDKKVYTHQTRQIVTFQELLHGNVLALRAYLLGNAKRFIVPIPGKPIGGRPLKVGYKLYGRSAGPTNFFKDAEKISTDWELKLYPKKK